MKTIRHLLLICIGIFWAQLLTAGSDPKVKFTFGQQYELPKGHWDLGFLGNMKDGFVQVSYARDKSISLQHFSPALKLTGEKMIDLKGMPKGFASEDFVTINGRSYWLYNVYDKKAQTEHLYAQEIDVKKGDFKGAPREQITCKKIGSYIKWRLNYSSDSSHIYAYIKFPNEKRDNSKNYQEYGLWVFDRDFKLEWSMPSIRMPYTEKKMAIKDVQGDRDGNFLFLTRVFNDESEKLITKEGEPNFHFEILKFSEGKKEASITSFEFNDKYVSQVTLLENLQGKIVACGFYADRDNSGKLKARGTKVDGSFFMDFDSKNNKLTKVHKGFYEIPNEVFKMYESNKLQKKMEKAEEKGDDLSAMNMVLRRVIFGEDGSMLLLGEEYYWRTYTYRCGNSYCTRTVYYYNDIIAQYIDGSGEQTWAKKIPKKQSGSDTWFNLGFRVLPYAGGNYLFFFDNIKNLNPNPGDDVYPHTAGWGGVLMAVRLDKSGDVKKTKVFDVREIKEWVNFMNADKVEDNMLMCRAAEGGWGFKPKPSKICLIKIE